MKMKVRYINQVFFQVTNTIYNPSTKYYSIVPIEDKMKIHNASNKNTCKWCFPSLDRLVYTNTLPRLYVHDEQLPLLVLFTQERPA